MVTLNMAEHRYELTIDGSKAAAFAYFRDDENGHRVLTHAEVPFEFSGQGIASRLASGVFEDARARGIRLVLQCPFMSAWFARQRGLFGCGRWVNLRSTWAWPVRRRTIIIGGDVDQLMQHLRSDGCECPQRVVKLM